MKRLSPLIVSAFLLAAGFLGGHALELALRHPASGSPAAHREKKSVAPDTAASLAAAAGILERAALLFSLAGHASVLSKAGAIWYR